MEKKEEENINTLHPAADMHKLLNKPCIIRFPISPLKDHNFFTYKNFNVLKLFNFSTY